MEKKRWSMRSRHHCDICDIWMDNNRASISLHENGWRHKNNMRMSLNIADKMRRQKESDMQRQTAMINKVPSKHSIAAKRAKMESEAKSIEIPLPGGLSEANAIQTLDIIDDDEYMMQDDEILGQYYNVDSQFLYLMGDWHEDMIIPGALCEVFHVEGEDGDWKSGVIDEVLDSDRISVKVLNETIYEQAEEEDQIHDQEQVEVEEEKHRISEISITVSSNDIRFIAPMPPERSLTGLGEWKTISSASVDEEKLQGGKDENQAVNYDDENGFLSSLSKGTNRDKQEDNEEESVYKTFNPFGGAYRGIVIEEKRFDSNNDHFGLTSSSKSQYSNLDNDNENDDKSGTNGNGSKAIKFKKRIKRSDA